MADLANLQYVFVSAITGSDTDPDRGTELKPYKTLVKAWMENVENQPPDRPVKFIILPGPVVDFPPTVPIGWDPPAGSQAHELTTTLQVRSYVGIEGYGGVPAEASFGRYSTIIYGQLANAPLLRVGNPASPDAVGLDLKDIVLVNTATDGDGIALLKQASAVNLTRVMAAYCGRDGITGTRAGMDGLVLEQCQAMFNGRHGAYFYHDGVNAPNLLRVNGGRFAQNGRNQIIHGKGREFVFQGTPGGGGGQDALILSTFFGKKGALLMAGKGTTFITCTFEESDGLDDFAFLEVNSDDSYYVSGGIWQPNPGAGSSGYGGWSKGVEVLGCFFHGGSLNTGFPTNTGRHIHVRRGVSCYFRPEAVIGSATAANPLYWFDNNDARNNVGDFRKIWNLQYGDFGSGTAGDRVVKRGHSSNFGWFKDSALSPAIAKIWGTWPT
jgi:hypothetical protein